MCGLKMEYDATASWSGYTYQGKVAIYITLKKINSMREINQNCNVESYFLELEWLEDFAILYENELHELVYESIHQVKARKDQDLPAYSSALIKLLQKVNIDGDIINAYLHTTKDIVYHNGWISELKDVSVDDTEVTKWINDINTLLADNKEKNKFVTELPKKRSNFSSRIKKCSEGKQITLENIDEILNIFMSELQTELNDIHQGFSDEILKKVSLYTYENGQAYCNLDAIDELITQEMKRYWSRGAGLQWKITDQSFQEIVLRCLTGIIDSHITKRHKNYGSKNIEKLNFREFDEILKSDVPNERCKEYYIFIIKEKLLAYCDEFEKTCHEDCEDENNFSECETCQIGDIKNKILEMSFDELNEFVVVTNPDISSEINIMGFSDYCERNRYLNPFYSGIKEIVQRFGKEKTPISYTDKDKKLYLLTTICDNGIGKKPIKQVCRNIIENTALSDVFMDYEVIISKDLDSESILHDAGDFLSDFKREDHNIYHYKDVSMEKLETCKNILNL